MPVQGNCLSVQTSEQGDSGQWLYASLWLGMLYNDVKDFVVVQETSDSMPGSKGKLKIASLAT